MENYISTWFTLSFLNASDGSPNKTHQLVSRAQRARLFQPWMEWQAANTTETGLQFAAKDQFSHFNDVSNENLLLPYITALFCSISRYMRSNQTGVLRTTPVPWVGTTTTLKTSATAWSAWTGSGCRSSTSPCLASVSTDRIMQAGSWWSKAFLHP